MFKTALADAIDTATAAEGTFPNATLLAGNEDQVATFLAEAVAHLGLGLAEIQGDSVTLAADAADTTITGFTATFKVNGADANIVFAASAVTFPTGVKQYQGATQVDGDDEGTTVGDSLSDPWKESEVTPTLNQWSAVVTIDADGDKSLEANEKVLTFTKFVK